MVAATMQFGRGTSGAGDTGALLAALDVSITPDMLSGTSL
jgi:hypothetical protein